MFRKLAVACLAVAASVASAQNLLVEKYRLPNGMTVILHVNHTLPVAAVNIWYHVGSKDEPDHRSGFAHLFEHLMFMGTKRVPTGQFDKIMEGGGGNNNASTAEDRTNFFSFGPSNLLPTLLWLDADRLQDLGNAMDQHKLDLQRDVVKNERRERTENTPYGKAYELINSLMFPKGHPYDHSVIGSMADLDAASVKDVQDFFSTYYVPNNASLVVAGDFDPKAIKPLIAQYFGTLPRQNDPVHRTAPPVAFPQSRQITLVDKVQAPKTIMVWHSPAAYQPGEAEMELAALVLSDGTTSRLYDRLVVKDKLATDVSASQDSLQLGSLFSIDVTGAPGADLPRINQAIDATLADFAKDGPKPDELQRAVAKIEFGAVSGLESIQNVADKLNEFEFYLGRPNAFRQVLDTYRRATPQSVRDEVRKWLKPSERLVMEILPQAETVDNGPDPRGKQPAIGAEMPFHAAAPSVFRLSNGVKVEFWRRPELPLMTIETMFWGGAALDPGGKFGRAALMADMLDEGAGNLDSASFHNALDKLGASFSASASALTTSAGLSVLSANFEPALSLYADALLRPRFASGPFSRVQRVTAAELEDEADDPDAVARKVAMREFFGPQSIYGRQSAGTPETVRRLAPADAKAAHDMIFRPQNATIFVAGSLVESEVKAKLERAFAGWRGSGSKIGLPAPPPAGPAHRGLRVFVVDKPGAVQTVVRFVMPAPTSAAPQRPALLSLNTILGGAFTSRLNQNIRETHGYAYGAGSSFTFGPTVGYLVASSDVRADVTGPSIREFLAEFKRLKSGDVSAEEARKAASTRRAELVSSMGSLAGLISVAASLEINGRSFSDFGRELSETGKLSAADLNQVADAAIPLDRAVLVLVGDKTTILKQLQGLDLPTPVEVKATP